MKRYRYYATNDLVNGNTNIQCFVDDRLFFCNRQFREWLQDSGPSNVAKIKNSLKDEFREVDTKWLKLHNIPELVIE